MVLRFRFLDLRIPIHFEFADPDSSQYCSPRFYEPQLPPLENQRYCSNTALDHHARTNVSRETFPSRTSRTQRPTRQRNLQEEQPVKHAAETMTRTSAKTGAASSSADDDRLRYEKPAPLGTGARAPVCDFRSASHTTIYVGNFIPLSPEAASPKAINLKASLSENINTLPLNHSVKRESRACRLEKYGGAPRNEKNVSRRQQRAQRRLPHRDRGRTARPAETAQLRYSFLGFVRRAWIPLVTSAMPPKTASVT